MKSLKIIASGILLLSLISFTSFSQINLLTGIDKGSYWQMGMDMSKTLGDFTTVTTDTTENWAGKDSVYSTIKRVPMLNVLSTKGSSYNFYKMSMDPYFEVAFMQYDVLLNAQLEDIKKYTKKTDSIMVLCPLGYEEIHLITLKTSKISGLADLKGKQVAVGAAGQGTTVTANFIKTKTGIEWVDVKLAPKDAMPQLLSGKIDAFFFVGAAPVMSLNGLSPTFEKLKLVPIVNKALDEYYIKTTIPKGTYHWNKDVDIATYGVRTVLVSDVSKETLQDKKNIKAFLQALNNKVGDLQETGHPNWKRVDFNFSDVKWEIHPIAKDVFGIE